MNTVRLGMTGKGMTEQDSIVHKRTIQYNTARYSIVQYSTFWCGIVRSTSPCWGFNRQIGHNLVDVPEGEGKKRREGGDRVAEEGQYISWVGGGVGLSSRDELQEKKRKEKRNRRLVGNICLVSIARSCALSVLVLILLFQEYINISLAFPLSIVFLDVILSLCCRTSISSRSSFSLTPISFSRIRINTLAPKHCAATLSYFLSFLRSLLFVYLLACFFCFFPSFLHPFFCPF